MIKVILSLTTLYFILFSEVYCQNDQAGADKNPQAGKTDSFAMFESDQLINASIEFDIGAFQKKNPKGEAIDGIMSFILNGSDSIKKEIKIKPRGIFRKDYCGFPPMEVTFRKPVKAYQGSDGFKKFKLVTHCQQGKGSDDYLLREYLVYKIYNILTDTSYNVRLFKIDYIDSKKNKKTISQYAFAIEPADILAERINAIRLKNVSLTQKQIIPEIITRIGLFNYMIGNYDWAVPNQHNIHIFKSKDVTKALLAIAVTYDFDFTGFVNPYYATPTDETGLKSVRQRLFTGMCRSREDFTKELMKFKNRKAEIYSVINDFPYLEQRSKKDLTDYLSEFFNMLDSGSGIEKLIDNLELMCKKL